MSIDKVPLFASFVAGIATFVSPCILPLIPAYLSFITGETVEELSLGSGKAFETFLNAAFFVAGFSLIFVLLGASASYLGNLIFEKKDLIRWVGGIVVIIFGLHITGLTPVRLFYREKRLGVERISFGYVGSFLVGIAFAIGWTPCVGPILSSILILASTQETVSRGMVLLVAYSLGLGIPFLITALFVNAALRLFGKIKSYYRYIEIVSGTVLVAVGVLIITGGFERIAGYFSR